MNITARPMGVDTAYGRMRGGYSNKMGRPLAKLPFDTRGLGEYSGQDQPNVGAQYQSVLQRTGAAAGMQGALMGGYGARAMAGMRGTPQIRGPQDIQVVPGEGGGFTTPGARPPPGRILPAPINGRSFIPSKPPAQEPFVVSGVGNSTAVPQPGPASLTNLTRTPNSGGQITFRGATRTIAGDQAYDDSGILGLKSVQQAPPPLQTESANPMSGAAPALSTAQPAPTPGQSLGFSTRGSGIPRGADQLPGAEGETNPFARRFSNPNSRNIYASYVRSLFGDEFAAV